MIWDSDHVVIDGNAASHTTLLFAHGAGAGMQHEFMLDIAQQLAAQGIRVVRFNFPYMVRRAKQGSKRPPDRAPKLLAVFAELVAHFAADSERLFIAGKSMGGRMASLLCVPDADIDERIVDQFRGVMCLGFPFHPPKQVAKFKGAHLAEVTKPILILQGERDTFGNSEEISHFNLADSVSYQIIADGDHSFKPRVRSGFTQSDNRQQVVKAMLQFMQQH